MKLSKELLLQAVNAALEFNAEYAQSHEENLEGFLLALESRTSHV